MKKIIRIYFEIIKRKIDVFIQKIRAITQTYYYYNFSVKRILELTLLFAVVILLFWHNYICHIEHLRRYIVFILSSWSFFAFIGLFVPNANETFTFGITTDSTPEGHPGVPLKMQLSSSGGFIAGKRISMDLQVLNLDSNNNTKQIFRDSISELSVVYFSSISVPFDKGKYLEGTPEAGGVSIDMKTLKGKSDVIFNSPGEYNYVVILKHKKSGQQQVIKNGENNVISSKIHISSHSTYVSIRNYSISYSFTIIIIILTLIQLSII